MIPLILRKQIPKGINHFRVGESLFFGLDLFTGDLIPGMEGDVFKLFAQVIEITRKPVIPIGELEKNPSGELFEIDESDYGRWTYRAIIDIGRLDVSEEYLILEDPSLEMSGASSDMLIIDLGENKAGYKVGDWISFRLKYMGALGLMNSSYITKNLVTEDEQLKTVQ